MRDGWSLTEVPPLTGRVLGRRASARRRVAVPHPAASAGSREAESASRDRGEPAVFTFHPWELDPAHPPMDGPPADPRARSTSSACAVCPERFARWLARDRCVALADAPRGARAGMSRRAAFLFPGQLSEWVGMGRDFLRLRPRRRAALFALTSERCGRDLARLIFEGPEEALHENLAAQAGVYLVSTLAARALERAGGPPERDGRATASATTPRWWRPGAIDYEEALDVLVAVWRETERLGIRGAMARRDRRAPGGRRRGAALACASRGAQVWIGNVNASTQFVLTGAAEGVAAALEELRPAGPLGPAADDELADPQRAHASGRGGDRAPDRGAPDDPRTRACRTTAPRAARSAAAEDVRRLLGTAFCFPTLWKETFEAMVADGHRLFLEAGPGRDALEDGRAGSTVRRAVVRRGTVEAIRAAVDIVAAAHEDRGRHRGLAGHRPGDLAGARLGAAPASC